MLPEGFADEVYLGFFCGLLPGVLLLLLVLHVQRPAGDLGVGVGQGGGVGGWLVTVVWVTGVCVSLWVWVRLGVWVHGSG